VKEFTSEHFYLQHVAEGAFAAIASPNGGAFSNAGIIDLGEKTIIFDAMETPQASGDLKNAAIFLTGRDPEYLVLSHKHHDHWGGSGEFLDVPLFVTAPLIKQDMMREAEEILNNPDEIQQDLEARQEEIRNAITEAVNQEEKNSLKNKLKQSDYVLKSLAEIRYAIPNLTFIDRITISGNQRELEIVNTGPGHTSCDICLVLPDEKVCFLGDLGFFECHPFMGDAFPAQWKQTLLDLARTETRTFIPGHGRVGTELDLQMLVDYFDAITAISRDLISSNFPEERLREIQVPEKFEPWHLSKERFEINLKRYQELARSQHK
jgi:glyoxylase-like metal-dependent hydrolase (beta-lactamase superfamily II)